MFNYAKLFRFYEYIQPYLKYSLPVENGLPLEKVLVIAPHPDDEAIGCGGTLLKHIGSKGLVKVVYLTIDKERNKEARKSLEMLNITDSEFYNFEIENINIEKAVNKMSETLLNFKPEIVFVPFILDNHKDHRTANEILIRASRLNKFNFLVYAYPVWFPVYPNVLIDISNVWEAKKILIEIYQSQILTRDYVNMAESLARYWATVKGRNLKYLETFFRASISEYSDLCKKIYGE